MNLYTSYFGNLKNIPPELITISIARFPPRWYTGRCMETLAPPEKLLWKVKQGRISRETYTIEYLKAIDDQYTPKSLFRELESIYLGKDPVLLCFEKKGAFCHRRLLADWLQADTGVTIGEL